MNFSILTYNTLFNTAFLKLDPIINQFQPDILCLQEIETDSFNLKTIESKGYVLADYSNSFIKFGKIYGVATFYNSKKFLFIRSDSLKISGNLTELFFTLFQTILGINKPKTVLRCDFINKLTKKKLTVCNAHLIVIASNELRVNHINKALKLLNIEKKTSLIVGGDFNYLPYRRKKLENLMKKYGLIEATKNIRQTMNIAGDGILEKFTSFQRFLMPFFNKFLVKRIKTDYVFYKGLKLVKTERIEVRYSDHYPIISTFSI